MEKIIGTFNKTKDYETRVKITDFDKNPKRLYIDTRRYFRGANNEIQPMRKGIAVPTYSLSEFINILEKAEAEVKNVKSS